MDRPVKRSPLPPELIQRLLELSGKHEHYLKQDLRKQESARGFAGFQALAKFTETKINPPVANPAPPQTENRTETATATETETAPAPALSPKLSTTPLKDPDVLKALLEFHRAHQPLTKTKIQSENARGFMPPRAPTLNAVPKASSSFRSRRPIGATTILRAPKVQKPESSSDT